MGKGGGQVVQPRETAAQVRANALAAQSVAEDAFARREAAQAKRDDKNRRLAEDEKKRVAAQEEAQKIAYGHQLNIAMRNFQSGARNSLNDRGLTGTLRSKFIPLIDQKAREIHARAPNTGTGNAHDQFDIDSVLDDLIGRQQGYERTRLNQQLNPILSNGFDTNYIQDTADDAYIDDIVNSRYEDAFGQLDRSFKRGNLNQSGFDSGLAALGDQRLAATSRLQDVGGGILETGRESLRTIGTNARGQANNFSFGDLFDIDGVQSNLQSTTDSFLGGLQGKLTNAIGSDELFDINDVLFRSGTGQGAQNAASGSPALLGAIAADQERKNKKIGLGNEGMF